jgi:putative oxidoreductase
VKGTLESIGLLLLRLGMGALLLIGHGWPKLMHYQQRSGSFADPIGLGPAASFALVVFAEVFCAALVMLGLLTRLAAVPIVIFLGVAFFIHHAHDPWAQRELALLYLLPFLTLVFTGAGRFSLDAGWAPWRRKGGA